MALPDCGAGDRDTAFQHGGLLTTSRHSAAPKTSAPQFPPPPPYHWLLLWSGFLKDIRVIVWKVTSRHSCVNPTWRHHPNQANHPHLPQKVEETLHRAQIWWKKLA